MINKALQKFIFLFLFPLFFFNPIQAENSSQEALREKFSDVLLVVHYNHPYYQSIPFIKEIYSSIFPNIVFYGEHAHPEVHVVSTYIGYTFSRVVSDVFDRFPGYEGYIFLQDDCLMNFWNYSRLDTDKIWFRCNCSNQFIHADINDPSTHGWWFASSCGMEQVKPALKQITHEEAAQLEKNHGRNQVVGQMCDMFYIPGKFSEQAGTLSRVFSNVFCEIAIPTLLSCIDDIDNWEVLNSLWAPQCETVFNGYSPQYDWVHPLKFSSEIYRNFVREQINLNFGSN